MTNEPIKIVLIEDNPTDALFIRRMLGKIFPVNEAPSYCESLRDGLACLRDTPADLVLLDLSLPDSHGMETLEKVRTQETVPAIIVLTGLNDEEMAIQALKVGAQDYLVKGDFDDRMLGRSIHHAIERHRLKIQIEQQAEDVRSQKNNLHNIISCNFDGIVILDAGCRILFANPAAEKLLCQPLQKLIGNVFPADVSASTVTELKIVRDQGDHIVVDLRTAKVEWHGKPGLVVSIRDLTERVEMLRALKNERGLLAERVEERTAELAATNTELQKALRNKDYFLATMSHELRTPMNAIIGYSEMLADKIFGELNTKQCRYVDHILTSGRHLLDLINDILDLAKIEAEEMSLFPSDFRMDELLREVMTVIRPLAANKRIELDAYIPDNVGPVHADRQRLKQVMCNLLSNAVKFTPEAGFIRVSAKWGKGAESAAVGDPLLVTQQSEILTGEPSVTRRPQRHPTKAKTVNNLKTCPTEPETATSGSTLCISVADSGIGIKPEDIGRVFGQFEQVDSTYAREQQGTGLGLAITKHFVELHGGRIWVESEGQGKGATFNIELPMETALNDAQPESRESCEIDGDWSEANDSDSENKTIVVIEDDRRMWEFIGSTLEAEGYQTVFTANGKEGLRKVQDCQPVAVLLDIFLPVKDGLQVLTELKSCPATWDIPVVVMSVESKNEIGNAFGAADWLVKPVSRPHLLNVVQRHERHRGGVIRTILIIDDEPDCVEILAEYLVQNGHATLKAYSGLEGLEIIALKHPDLVILDLMMPEMTGFDVIDRLKSDANTKDIPVVINTAKDLTPEDLERLQGKTEKILSKSVRNELCEFVNEITGKIKKKETIET